MQSGKDGLPLVLFIKLPSGTATFCKWGGVHEPTQVEILFKVGQSVFHFVVVKECLHKRNLNVGLRNKQ